MMTEQKNVFVVLGMARSGTSVIARGLKALGVDLGKNLIPAKNTWNAKGFWEDSDIVYKINRTIVRVLNYSWEMENLIDRPQYRFELESLKKVATQLLKQRLSNTHYWGFKDPRTAKLLLFWQSVFSRMNLKEHYIIAVRNPLSSASSFTKLSGYDLEVGLLLWLMHLIPAIDHTMEKKRVVVSYDLMMQQPREQLERIKQQLHIPLPTNAHEIDQYANEFLDRNLHHYEYNNDDLKSHPDIAIAPLCVRVYDLLMLLARDEVTFEDEHFLNSWREIKTEYATFFRAYCYIGELLNRNKQLDRKLRSIRKSILWKLLFPLRLVEDIVRSVRRKSKKKKRLIKAYG